MKQIRITVQDLQDLQQHFLAHKELGHSLCSPSIVEFEKLFGTSFDFNAESLRKMKEAVVGTLDHLRFAFIAKNAGWIVAELFGKFPMQHTTDCPLCAYIKQFKLDPERDNLFPSEEFAVVLAAFESLTTMPKPLASARSWANRMRVIAKKQSEARDASRGIGSFGEIIDSEGKL